MPRLSVEELLRLDPDAIVVLIADAVNGPSDDQVLYDFRALEPLSARKNQRISVLRSEAAFGNGPRILTLEAELRQELRRLFPPLPGLLESARPLTPP